MLRQFWCVMSSVVKPSVARRTSSQILLKLAGHKGGGGMDSESMQCAHSVASIGCSWSVLPGMKYSHTITSTSTAEDRTYHTMKEHCKCR